MGQRFKVWRDRLDRFSPGEAEFQKWLFIRIAGVLFGGKGGELLILRSGSYGLNIGRQIKCLRRLSALWQCCYLVLSHRNIFFARVIVYDSSAVERTLSEVPCGVLDQMGYYRKMGPKQFLEEVGRRWRRREEIPHEIGLALGYPVKDVLGFIGLMPLQRSGICGWRIYGGPEPSLLARQKYREARTRAEVFLGNYVNEQQSKSVCENAVPQASDPASQYMQETDHTNMTRNDISDTGKEVTIIREESCQRVAA